MRRIAIIFAATCAMAMPVLAQNAPPPAPDPQMLQRLLAPLQKQRNDALDAAAVSEARLAGVTEDLAKVRDQLRELQERMARAPQPAPAPDNPAPQ